MVLDDRPVDPTGLTCGSVNGVSVACAAWGRWAVMTQPGLSRATQTRAVHGAEYSLGSSFLDRQAAGRDHTA